ncbi:MAG: hypothetical protein K2P33_00710, partial [Acutalibacter sp.]|nr:hypothetical protein [Acutalibacter sp.]
MIIGSDFLAASLTDSLQESGLPFLSFSEESFFKRTSYHYQNTARQTDSSRPQEDLLRVRN